MMYKKCLGCGEIKSLKCFHKNKSSKDGFQSYCKTCRSGRYHNSDKSHKKAYDATRYFSMKEERKVWRRNHYLDNKEYYREYNKNYYENNKDLISKCGSEYNNAPASYELFKDKLTVDECSRLSDDGISIEVKCRYCGKYFIPTYRETYRRVYSLNNTDSDTSGFLYCSGACKKACPTYQQKKYPKGFREATSREVQPELRQMVLERDGWVCQKCGATEVELHCHHIEGVMQNPIESADIDNCITLCKSCHKEVHKEVGCRYTDLQCKEG